MLLTKYITVLLFCVGSIGLLAQEVYIWNAITENGIEGRSSIPEYYEMHRYTESTNELSILFSLTTPQFDHGNTSGQAFFISSIAIDESRDTIYMLEDEGDLYRYTLSDSNLTYLKDLTPVVGNVSYNILNITDQIDFISNFELLITGKIEGIYNIKTDSFIKFDDCAEPCNTLSNTYSTLKYKNCYLSRNYSGEILKYTLQDPYNWISIFTFPEITYGYLYSTRNDCEHSEINYLEYISSEYPLRDSIYLYTIDIDNQALVPKHQILGFNNNIAQYRNEILDIYNFDRVEWEYCQRRIDLDDDDSTVDGVDFLMDSLCSFDNSPLSDLDLKISNEYPIDSITINIIGPLFTQYLHFPSGNYNLRQGDNFWQVIVNNGSSSIADFEDAIRNAYFYTDIVSSEVQIEFIIWYNGVSGDAAIATLRLASDLPMSGDDIEQEWCIGDIGLTLENILATNADIGGDFYDKNYNIITSMPEYIAAGTDTIYYITNNNICYDTALIVNVVNPYPILEPLPDVTLCDKELSQIDLSTYLEDVEWNNGSMNKIRVLNQADIYSYELQNIHGCKAVDTFEVTKLPPPVTKPIEAKVCIGEQFNFMNKAYTEAGIYRDTLLGIYGCDSIIYNIDFDYYERINIELVGDLEFCEGESITLEIISQHNDLMINDEATEPFLMIDQAGRYIISGYDQNGCFQSEAIEILTNPNPVVTTQDLIDTVFTPSLELPVKYLGNIITYDWSPSSSLSCDDCSDSTLKSPESGTYYVDVTDENGCYANGQVVVKFKESNIFLPTIISKNPIVEENGILNLKGSIASKYSLQVYDRWGNLQYNQSNLTINDSSQGWRPSRDIVQGVYVYMITYSDGQEIKKIAGDITIME